MFTICQEHTSSGRYLVGFAAAVDWKSPLHVALGLACSECHAQILLHLKLPYTGTCTHGHSCMHACTHTHTHTHTHAHTHTHTSILTHPHTHTHTHTDRHTQTDKQTGRQTDTQKQTDRHTHTNRQTDRHTHIHLKTVLLYEFLAKIRLVLMYERPCCFNSPWLRIPYVYKLSWDKTFADGQCNFHSPA